MKKYANKIFLGMIAVIVICFVVIIWKLIEVLSSAI